MNMKSMIESRINYREFYSRFVDLGNKKPNPKGEVLVICPFHNDHKPSLSINLNNGLSFCLSGCGGWNVIGFYAKITNVKRWEAKNNLAKELGISMTGEKHGSSYQQKDKSDANPLPMNLVEHCVKALEKSPEHQKYLQENRGISPDVWKKYQLGIFEGDTTIPVIQDGVVVNVYKHNPNRQPKILPWSAGRPVTIYPWGPVIGDKVIICEGQFDGMCLESFTGLEWRTGTGGANTWKEEWNSIFKDKDVVIAYDADEAGMKGTERVMKNLTGIAASIKTIAWPEFMADKQHKDITDFFVTSKQTAEDFMRAISVAKETSSIPDVEVRGNQYFRKGSSYPLSNFRICVKAKIQQPDGISRQAVLIGIDGTETEPFTIKPESMSSVISFKTFILGLGDFIYDGKADDLNEIWKLELLQESSKTIVRPDHIGWYEKEELWLFGNCAVKDGTIYEPDDDGIIWIGDRGYQPLCFYDTTDVNNASTPVFDKADKIAAEDVKVLLYRSFGGFEPLLGLAWIFAVMFGREILAEFKTFPILFIEGKRQAGKTTLARWLMNFFGMPNAARSISETTQTALSRMLGYFSSLPIHMDEYRNSSRITSKDSFLRSVYDRQGAGKGRIETIGIRQVPVRGFLVLSGEETPEDNALLTRCVVLSCSGKDRDDALYSQIEPLSPRFSSITLDVLKNKANIWPKVLASIKMLETAYSVDLAIDPRTAKNYSIVGGTLLAIVGNDPDFRAWLDSKALAKKTENDEQFVVNDFFEDLVILATMDKIDTRTCIIKDDKIYLWYRAVYDIWAQYVNTSSRREIPKRNALLSYLRKEDFFIKDNYATRFFGCQTVKALVLDFEKCPPVVKGLIVKNHAP